MTWLTSMFRRLMHERHDEGRADTLRPGETVARARAEAFDQRVAFLAEASRILSSSLEYEATLSTVAHLAVPHLADWCAVDLVQRDGPVHRVAVAHVDPTRVQVALDLQRRYPFAPDAPYGPAKVLRTGRSELYPRVTDAMLVAVAQDATHLETLRWAGLTSGMCVPLVARGRTLGVLSFGSTKAGRMYGADDLALAEDLAHRAALAVDNARLYDETRQSDARHRAIIETALDCIIIIDVTGRIVEFNPAAERTFGLARAEAIGRDLVALIVPPALRAAHQEGLQRYLATGETRILGRRVEMSALRADGAEFPAELAIAHVATSGPPLFTAYLRDLSERKKLEAAREEAAALRSVSALAAAAAHEINNPLSVVVAQAGFLAREIGGPGRGRLDAIRNAAGKIAEILTDMSQIVSLQHVPSRPYLPDMLDLRRSIARTVPDSGDGPARTP